MSLRAAFFSLLLFILIPVSGQAALVKNLYEVTLPVAGQDRQLRNAAFEQAFVQVLVRVSGSSLSSTRIDLRLAPRYVQQYRYLVVKKPEAEQQPASSDAPPEYQLWVQFNEGAIKRLLQDNALPIWGQQRPEVLVWIAVRDGKNRYILRDQDQSAIKQAAEKEAARRGLPITWPRMDQDDRSVVSFADVWGSFWGPVLRASKRYAVNSVLIGRMDWQGSSWKVDWSLAVDGQAQQWRLKALDLELLMASGVDVATDQIAARFSVLEDVANQGQLVVHVNGVDGLRNYASTVRYLRSLAPVKSVYATRVEDNWVQFHVDLTGGKDDLRRIIALGRTLLPDTPPPMAVETPVPQVLQPVTPPSTDAAPSAEAPVPPQDEAAETAIDADPVALPTMPTPPPLPVVNMLTYRYNG